MQALIKLLNVVLELLQDYFRKRAAIKHAEDVSAIKADPAGKFIDEFGGMRDTTKPPAVSSDKANVAIDER